MWELTAKAQRAHQSIQLYMYLTSECWSSLVTIAILISFSYHSYWSPLDTIATGLLYN